MNKGIINCLSLLSCLLFIASCNSTNPDKNPVEVEDNVDPMEFFKVGEDYKLYPNVKEDVVNGFYDPFDTFNNENWSVGNGYWGLNNGGVSKDNLSLSEDGELIFKGNGLYYSKNDIKSTGAYKDGRKCGSTIISKFGVGPGHYEVKMKVFPRQGSCTAFWTYSNRAVPGQVDNDNHEIDIELPGGSKSGKITFKKALNTNWVTETAYDSVEYAISDVNKEAEYIAYNDNQYHTFGFDWYTNPECVVYFCDGKITNVSNIFVPTLEGKLWLGVWFPNGFTGVPQFESDYMYVDYVKYNPFKDQEYTAFDPEVSVATTNTNVKVVSKKNANKISNGDFEYAINFSGSENYNELGSRGWEFNKKVSEKQPLENVVNILPNIGTNEGNKCAAFVKDGGVLRQYIDSVYDNYSYNFSFDAKALNANDNNSFVKVSFLNGGGESLKDEVFTILNKDTFNHFKKTIQAPIGTDMIKVEVRTSTGNKVIIDNVRLEHI